MPTCEKEKPAVSIIMPVYNGESTINETLKSLLAQSMKFDEFIIIDDASNDISPRLIKEYLDTRRKYTFIQNEKRAGLAAAYNKGIRAAKGELIVTLHPDIILENGALEKLIKPLGDEKVVASAHKVAHPMEIWNKYNFWQKCFFARLAGNYFSGIDGKFDCFRRSALEKVGLFDEVYFKTAGEDGDIVFKLKKIGRIAQTQSKIIHIHKVDPDFSWKDIIRKQKQYSEAQGALLARGRITSLRALAKTFFRELMLIGLAIPYLWFLSLALIISYSFLYTKLVFQKEYADKRIFILPFLNIWLLFVSITYTLRGFVYGKQRI